MNEKEQPGLQVPNNQALPRFVPTLPRSYAQTKIPAVPSVPFLDAKRRERGQPVPRLDMSSGPMLAGVAISPRDDLLNNWGKGFSRSPEAERSHTSGRSPPRWPHPSNRSPRPTSPRPALKDLRDEYSPDSQWVGSIGMPTRNRLTSPRPHSPVLSPRRPLVDSVLCSPREALSVSNEVVTRLRRCTSEQHASVEANDPRPCGSAPGPDGGSPDWSRARSAREQRMMQSFRSPTYRNAAKSATSLAKCTKAKWRPG